MKKTFTYSLIFILLSLILLSCDKPAPTQLIDNSTDEVEYELLNDPLSENYYTSGVDTSGITQDIRNLANLISVSGIKVTLNNFTTDLSLAQAFFFNKSAPIYNSSGDLIAYETFAPGLVFFNGLRARVAMHQIRYLDRGIIRHTDIGPKFILFSGIGGTVDPFHFPYNSEIDFKLAMQNDSVNFSIPTPPELNGNVIMHGHRGAGNIKLELRWNAEFYNRITIIFGLIKQGQNYSIPVYRMRTEDDGELIIPGRLLNRLPLENFSKMVITFVRAFEKSEGTPNNSLFVSTQSIHSIILDIP